MTRKRGPNSPNESEKQKLRQDKPSTSAAASTLGMAAMMSVVSSVFSNQGASSVVSDSDYEDQQSQTQGQEQENVWDEANLNNSKVRSPKKVDGTITPLFSHHSEGAWRDEIEVEIQSKNDKKFTGTITPIEAKHLIYIGALKFDNHDNFDGVRISWKGKLIVTFKLIEPIDIDEMNSVEYFEFTRTSTIRGKRVEEKIGGKIKGIRSRPMTVGVFDDVKENDQKVVKIEGCEYRIPEEEILAWLGLYGEVTSKLEEDCFRDTSVTTGNNRSGNYSVMMKLDQNIPQLLPMCGRRIKIYHAGITKLCTQCFGEHKKQYCQSQVKVPWTEYVKNFIIENDQIPSEFYGKWTEIVKKVSSEQIGKPKQHPRERDEQGRDAGHQLPAYNQPLVQPREEERETSQGNDIQESPAEIEPREPTEEEFDIPTTEEAYERMVERFASIGLAKWETDKAIENKRTAYNRACREFKKMCEKKKKSDESKSKRLVRKNSIQKS
jgi:hypothetical protein